MRECDVAELIQAAAAYVNVPVRVAIHRRDKEGCVVGVKSIPVTRVKTNYDGNGVVIIVENDDVQSIPWETTQ